MSRKDHLEENIRSSYNLVHEYETIVRETDNPKEKMRSQRNI